MKKIYISGLIAVLALLLVISPVAATNGCSVLTVTTPQCGSVHLSWTSGGSNANYWIGRNENGGSSYVKIGETASTSFDDSSVTAGHTYYYALFVWQGTALICVSNQASAAVTSCTPTTPPTTPTTPPTETTETQTTGTPIGVPEFPGTYTTVIGVAGLVGIAIVALRK